MVVLEAGAVSYEQGTPVRPAPKVDVPIPEVVKRARKHTAVFASSQEARNLSSIIFA